MNGLVVNQCVHEISATYEFVTVSFLSRNKMPDPSQSLNSWSWNVLEQTVAIPKSKGKKIRLEWNDGINACNLIK